MKPELSTYQFSGQQQTLYIELSGKDTELADMYLGALIVLKQGNNPDRFSHSAHGIRELMEKLPRFYDVEIKEQTTTLKSKVHELRQACQPLIEKIDKCNLDKPEEKSDGFLNKIKVTLEAFFSWFEKHHPTRKAEIAKTLQKIDGVGRAMPQPLEKLNVQYWDEMRDYFQAIAHHRKKPTEKDYRQWMDAFERFLLDRLYPRTFADFDELDKLIQKGETNA
jgi:hypothetical protein